MHYSLDDTRLFLFEDQILKPAFAALHGMTLQDQKSRTDMDNLARTVPTLP